MKVSTIRPGYMVGLKTSLRGNVSYRVSDIDARVDTFNVDGSSSITEATRVWRTERTTRDVEEYNAAIVLRSRARSLVLKWCIRSDLVYLCPLNDYAKLEACVEEASKLVAEFNRNARITTISFSVITGKIEANDALAIKSINQELRELLQDMTQGVANLDPAAIAKAANAATQVSRMLSADVMRDTKAAIGMARAAARKLRKAGNVAGQAVDRVLIERLTQARSAFIDADGQAMPDVMSPTVTATAIDFDVSADTLATSNAALTWAVNPKIDAEG